MGAEAVFAVLDAQQESPAVIIAIDGNQIVTKKLMQCVERVCSSLVCSLVFNCSV